MIVIISDIHLGYEKCNRDSFESFVTTYLLQEDIDYLILLGDIIDFWRRSAENVLRENKEILTQLSDLNAKKYYILGNHDYTLPQLTQLQFTFRKNLLLQSGQKKFRFIHGYQIEYASSLQFYEGLCTVLCTSGDETGQILSDAWNFYQLKIREIPFEEIINEPRLSNLSKEELGEIVELIMRYPEERPLYGKFTQQEIDEYRKRAGVGPDEFLVYGHTHNPCVKRNEANAGSWVSDSRRPNSYLTIEDGKVDLNYWESVYSNAATEEAKGRCEYAEVF